ncbi:DoxX family protein [Paroceanicella profunda]|uniref:DoxX family protein n=1 Tax=Paroceanicella profunda TaxID=2579971 RepID=A0A5B8FGN6_9RHOB|nr:DoxX family protein [Paroceanicella profunda]QDL91098.1 DoxX family protein [Paroceanicella profunda]
MMPLSSAPARLRVARRLCLLALCAAYIQGPLTKIADFPGALAEMTHFGLTPAPLFAVGVIGFELVASAMVVSGYGRRIAALALAAFTLAATLMALRFWEMESGPARSMATNGFFEHVGLAGAFLYVALTAPVADDRRSWPFGSRG